MSAAITTVDAMQSEPRKTSDAIVPDLFILCFFLSKAIIPLDAVSVTIKTAGDVEAKLKPVRMIGVVIAFVKNGVGDGQEKSKFFHYPKSNSDSRFAVLSLSA